MYRGNTRPQTGGYPPAAPHGFYPRGTPPPLSRVPYRPSSSCSNGYPPDYRRSPPGRGPGDEYRYSAHRYSPSGSYGGLTSDHSIVITVGNELTHPSQRAGTESSYARDYSPHRSSHKVYDEPSLNPSTRSHGRSRSRSPDRIRSKSRTRAVSRGRSKSRTRAVSRSRSKSRTRAVSRGRSKSRTRAVSRGRSKSRTRAVSRSRSKSRTRAVSRGRSKSRTRAVSRGRSKSRTRAVSRSRSRSRARSRARSKARSRSRGRCRSRRRTPSRSESSNSSSSSDRRSRSKRRDDFEELRMARRRKELENMLSMPTKSILKKRVDSSDTNSPMINQETDSPRSPGLGLSKDAEELLSVVGKGINPALLASVLSHNPNSGALEDLIRRLQPAKESEHDFSLSCERSSQESTDLTQLLGVMAEAVRQQQDTKKNFLDIDDEEKFLYGDDEEDEDKIPTKDVLNSGQSSLSTVFENTGADALLRETNQDSQHHDAQHEEYGASQSPSQKQGKHGEKQYASTSVKEPCDYPPGTEPSDAKGTDEVEEYEKISDLLKTIGLDLGVTEISKMAARTQERLHGKNPAKKPPKRPPLARRHRSRSSSSGTSSSSSRSSSSGSRSGSSSRSRSGSRGTYKHTSRHGRKKSAPSERRPSQTLSQREAPSGTNDDENTWTNSAPRTPEVGAPVTSPFPVHPAHQMPPYTQAHQHGVLPSTYPPPGYDAYGNYVSYMPQGWPMYPPPGIPPPPLPQSPIELPYLKVIDPRHTEDKGAKVDPVHSMTIACSGNQRRVMEEKNNAKQKQKVTEELIKLKEDKEARMRKKDGLIKELETLRKHQGEVLRKKRREKDGHKDPILLELGRLQENVMGQISRLRVQHEEAERKYDELLKVAKILGLDHKNLKSREDHELSPPHRKSKEPRSPEKSRASSSTSSTQRGKSSTPRSSEKIPEKSAELFDYYDAGNHWCKNCNTTSGSMFDFFTHLHSKTHRKTLDLYDRPWVSNSDTEKKCCTGQLVSKPAKGSEFLIPVRGFFCQLCKTFIGDPVCAESHVTCQEHNEKYKKHIYKTPLYEARRKLDRQAGMESQMKQTDQKRKHEDDSQNEDESRNEFKRAKSKDTEEERPLNSKEHEQKSKCIKVEQHDPKTEKEERTRYAKEEVERSRYRKEERYRQRKAAEEKYKHEYERSRYKEENRYKHEEEDDRHRYRKEDERSKSRRDDEKRYKHGRETGEGRKPKYSEEEASKWPKSKVQGNDDDEVAERENFKKADKKQHQKDKAAGGKDERDKTSAKDVKEPVKPAELPKVMCGPSPAMLAKLRKKNEEAGSRPIFSKFTWKKPEKTALEKEAERIAALFIKEEEKAEEEANKESESAFAKSVAAAKNIAKKLATDNPSHEWEDIDQVKIQPSSCTPSNFLRKSSAETQNKPAPDRVSSVADCPKKQPDDEPMLSADLISKAFGGEQVKLATADESSPTPAPSTKIITKTITSSTKTITSATKTITSVAAAVIPAPISKIQEADPVMARVSTLASITHKPDVAAPGVQEEEQHCDQILVRPPPKLTTSASTFKSARPKATLAAAKAKDLFDIFYGGGAMACSGVSSTRNKASSNVDSKARSECQVATQKNSSTQNKGPETKDSTQVFESGVKCEEPSTKTEEKSKPPALTQNPQDAKPLVHKDQKTVEYRDTGSVEPTPLDSKIETDTLDCLTSSEMIETIEMETNDTLSFSPPPGSFTEQLNLDTFEFSFDSL